MDYLGINKKLWNNRADLHYGSEFYDVDSFIKGKDSLNPIEVDLLGDITGKKILHLQCHFGQDTISLARRGALATGIDFSEKALEKAVQLNEAAGTDARFIRSDIYRLKDYLDEKFDIVFTSYGVVGWLPDLKKWAGIVHHFLKPGGKFVMVEFHPVVWMFSDDFKRIEYNYRDSGPIVEEVEGSYADPESRIKDDSVTWTHGLSDVIDPLVKTGLRITDFREYNYSPYDCFNNTVKLAEGKYQIRGLEDKLPMIYSLVAEKIEK